MSNANTNVKVNNGSSKGNDGTVKAFMGVIIFIVVIIGLYYTYRFLYGSQASQTSVTILNGTIPATTVGVPASGGAPDSVAVTQLTGLLDGGQYSTSFWVYVASTAGASATSPLVHLMEISNNRFAESPATPGKTLLFVGLNPTNGALIIRQSDSDTDKIDNSITSSAATSNVYPLAQLITGYNGGSVYKSDNRCDIINGIEYQRWVLITTVANGRTLDVYVDGKLARSCVYKSAFALGSATGTGTAYFGAGNGNTLKGFFSNGQFYNYALDPAAVWALYQAGPGTGFSISNFLSNLVSVNVNFGTVAGTT
jgi:hypothetical protein